MNLYKYLKNVHRLSIINCLGCIFFIFCSITGFTQDISQIKKSKPFSWTGSLNGGFSTVTSSNKQNQYSPFAYFIGANVNFTIYGINVPLSFTYRDRKGNYALPFSRFSFTPSYKWIKLHLGHCNVNFNPYVLSGVQIYGAGLELNPGKFRFGIISGEVKNTKVIVDTLSDQSGIINPFKRKVLGIKLGVGSYANYFDVLFLTGSDKNTLNQFTNDSINFRKESNTTIGTTFAMSFFQRKLNFKANAAASGYTYNQADRDFAMSDIESNGFLKAANSVIDVNQSTAIYFAGDAALTLNFDNFSIGGKYQRIDPQYKSFGIFLIRGDNENYTLNSNMSILKSKININGSYGLNRNNLHGLKKDNTIQKVYNINVGLYPVSWAGVDVTVSNFNFNQSPSITTIDDSLRFVQVNKTNSLNPFFSFRNKTYIHNIFINYTKQSIIDLSTLDFNSGDAYVTTYSLGYTLKNKVVKYSINASLFYTDNLFRDITTKRKGVAIGFNKAMLNAKLNNRIRGSFSLNSESDKSGKSQYNVSLSSSYSYSKRASISIQSMYGQRPNFKTDSKIAEFRFSTQLNVALN